ncbi:hypothetical protein ASPZODRAFT_12220 [Penicilliopsis zonata CBS 506.65]|uniref:Peptidase M20 domain-containing protein 2 n=1 Tax=Penicilliopsis zonata CBS 506.65 TaxID=1073090 RepID=A0A1L9SWG5_9EURO|nr:hypothetical protein ASPZODRAFT_12220 [Penicilliopsis zonata CBS 506.65]OJJ51393.1 hypothetical protein ASPZODRAFT_12220 [Penicilliopsis zonata CBS 506.65]
MAANFSKQEEVISQAIDHASSEMRELSLKIHENPETCYLEVQAHDNIVKYLESTGLTVTPHAFGLETAFSTEYGQGGRVVTFCVEYDALPVIGHGCGHNLIAVSSIAAFLGAVAALKATPNQPGRLRLLGTPAEEGGSGKIRLLEAGAFADVDVSLMSHPTPAFAHLPATMAGVSYATCLAAVGFEAHFTGTPAHAAQMPWAGVNAMDAAALSYSAIGMLRQQIKPTERINIIVPEGGTAHNVIPEKSRVRVSVRSETAREMNALRTRVENCFNGAALATGCSVNFVAAMDPYADIRPNESLAQEFARYMGSCGREYLCDLQNKDVGLFSTDMGNVSYDVPSLHGHFFIPAEKGVAMHTEGFRDAAKTPEAHEVTMGVAKGMAVAGLRVLIDDAFAKQVKEDFEQDKARR